jgi:hypothetical protein
MQLGTTKEDPMRTATLLAPVSAAERRLISAPTRRLEINREDLIRSIEISEDEILDDLLYPADHRAVRSGGWEPAHSEPR